MAWIDTTEVVDAQDANMDQKGNRTYTRVFLVQFSDMADVPPLALTATGIPERKSAYVCGNFTDYDTICTNLSAERVDGSTLIRVTANYSSDFQSAAENPIDEPPQYNWDWASYERDTLVDKDNQPILNAAGCIIEGVKTEESDPVLTVSWNSLYFDFLFTHNYRNAVNASAWTVPYGNTTYTFPARTAKILGPRAGTSYATQENTGKYQYWQISVSIAFNPNTWDEKLVDAGTKQKVDGELVGIFIDGQEQTTPWPLKADGTAMGVGDTPRIISKRILPERDFSIIGVPI